MISLIIAKNVRCAWCLLQAFLQYILMLLPIVPKMLWFLRPLWIRITIKHPIRAKKEKLLFLIFAEIHKPLIYLGFVKSDFNIIFWIYFLLLFSECIANIWHLLEILYLTKMFSQLTTIQYIIMHYWKQMLLNIKLIFKNVHLTYFSQQ